MNPKLRSIFSVADELTKAAYDCLPKLEKSEVIVSEKIEGGAYLRKTSLNEKIRQVVFDFKNRKLVTYGAQSAK